MKFPYIFADMEVEDMNVEDLDVDESVKTALYASKTNFTFIDKQLRNYGILDWAAELMWLVSNMVVSNCHHTLMGETDLWTDLYPYLHELFMEPIKEHW